MCRIAEEELSYVVTAHPGMICVGVGIGSGTKGCVENMRLCVSSAVSYMRRQLEGSISRLGVRYIVCEHGFEVRLVRFVGQGAVLLEVIVQELLMRKVWFATIAGDLLNGRLW